MKLIKILSLIIFKLIPSLKRRYFVLAYHAVNESEFHLSIKVPLLKEHFLFFKKNFQIDTPDSLLNFKKLKKNSIIITFDDGYKDNLYNLLPILEDLQIKATIFICPFYRTPKFPILSKQEIRQLSFSDLIHIGSHTLTHKILINLTDTQLRREIFDSKKFLEDIVQKPIFYFSYPKGLYNQKVKEMVKEAGYKCAFILSENKQVGISNLSRIDLFSIPRIWIPNKIKTFHLKFLLSPAIEKFSFFKRLKSNIIKSLCSR